MMRSWITGYGRRVAVATGIVLLALAPACSTEPEMPEGGAIVTFAFDASSDVIDVLILDEVTIAQAEHRVETGTGPRMPVGPIRRGAGIDARYPFHYVPDQVQLADVATEVCDGRPMKTPKAVDDFIEMSTGHRGSATAIWCPWGARPVAVQRR